MVEATTASFFGLGAASPGLAASRPSMVKTDEYSNTQIKTEPGSTKRYLSVISLMSKTSLMYFEEMLASSNNLVRMVESENGA